LVQICLLEEVVDLDGGLPLNGEGNFTRWKKAASLKACSGLDMFMMEAFRMGCTSVDLVEVCAGQ
jgi:hypothetical protein